MGIFSGDLRFTAYRGTNLLRMDALATTKEEWIAYKYEAGLKGLSTDLTPRVVWRDTGGLPQQYAFGGVVHKTLAPVKAQNRLLVAEGKGASLATFTPPHTFFFTREVDTNLGYVWYRKDSATTFGIGIRQADAEESPSTLTTSRCSTPRQARCSTWACTSTPAQIRPKARARRCFASRTATSSSRCLATRRS